MYLLAPSRKSQAREEAAGARLWSRYLLLVNEVLGIRARSGNWTRKAVFTKMIIRNPKRGVLPSDGSLKSGVVPRGGPSRKRAGPPPPGPPGPPAPPLLSPGRLPAPPRPRDPMKSSSLKPTEQTGETLSGVLQRLEPAS